MADPRIEAATSAVINQTVAWAAMASGDRMKTNEASTYVKEIITVALAAADQATQ